MAGGSRSRGRSSLAVGVARVDELTQQLKTFEKTNDLSQQLSQRLQLARRAFTELSRIFELSSLPIIGLTVFKDKKKDT